MYPSFDHRPQLLDDMLPLQINRIVLPHPLLARDLSVSLTGRIEDEASQRVAAGAGPRDAPRRRGLARLWRCLRVVWRWPHPVGGGRRRRR